MLGIYYLLLSIFIFQKSYSKCFQEPNGIFRFGPQCGFMCHCRNNEQCDDTTGECTSGCASFWYGPGCQYRDIAEGEFSRHSDNLLLGKHKYSFLANDGDKNTCSYTAEVQSYNKKVKPFWRVWFPTNETIRELEVVTLNATLQYFKKFSVYVEYISPAEKEKSLSAASYRRDCYKQGDYVPKSESFTVLCSNPVIGNQVRIELAELQTQLVLCDIRINGGRNVAFGSKTLQISTDAVCTNDTCSSDKAVDGNESDEDWWNCTFTAKENDLWWKIDLDHKTTIWFIRILLRKVETSTYQLEISNATNEVGKSTYDVSATASLQINLTLNIIGESVKLTKRTTVPLGRLEICEVYIYGDCLEDKCGYGCEQECHCKRATIWDKMSGSCTYGCKDGWMGSGCNIRKDCLNAIDGVNCLGRCSGHCKGGHTACNKADGSCSNGCNNGWKGQRCDQECDDGTFGSGCSQNCSGHCKNDKTCDKANGSCLNGCKEGYEGNSCSQTCPVGFYGNNCKRNCSENCVEGTCTHEDGKCTKGCTAGWKGKRCEKRCGSGQYGTNCSRKCSENCENECDHINGHCRCKAGWVGQTCEQECVDGTYGVYCRVSCNGNCKNGEICEKVNGSCPNGCKPGYYGKLCSYTCASGYFGDRCSRRCNQWCISSKCHHVDGQCTYGCLDGWIGRKCDKPCPDGFYGNNCKRNCSENCVKGTCAHEDGKCTKGCIAGWKQKRCEKRCDLGSYGMNCTRRCSTCEGGKCSNVDGSCLSRCYAGWKGQKCDQECNDGTYGYNCSMNCSRNCKNDDPCEKVYGACPNGCKLGFREDNCKRTCARGQYGENCNDKCSQYCLSGTCSHKDGRCFNGCVAGWTGLKCEERCKNGMYGKNCSGKCEHCKDGIYKCSHINGNCRLGCKAGWKGGTCDQACTSGNYGENCRGRCSQYCVGGNCEREYGQCISGCRDGYTGMKCDQRCQYGMYGKNCSRQCSDYCKNGKHWCSHVNGRCQYGCKAGWKGDTCDQECEDGTFGINCLTNCSGNCKNDEVCVKVNGSCRNGCKPGYEGKLCALGCRLGFYGINCSSKCSEQCNGGYAACSKVNGSCLSGCHDGWNGHRCDRKCDNGWFGQGCLNKCSLNCKDGDMCDEADGQCPNGCKPGYTGKMCTQNCTVGFFGDECRHNCSGYCEGGSEMCSNIDGHCMSGCKTGWKGTKCDIECSDGFYGFNCAKTCGKCKSGTVCHNVDGTCNKGCEAGYSGETCLQDCIVGFYGEECRHNCSSHCEGDSEMCNNIDGHCLSGCKAGWKGVKCDTECNDGFYGINCSATCGNCKSGTLCHKVLGTCSAGCESGYSGDHCLQGLQKSDNIVATTTGGVVALVILLIIVAVIAVIYRKRKEQRQRQEQTDTNLQLTSAVSRRNCDNVHLNAEAAGNTEENSFSTSEVNVSNNDPSVSKTKHTVPLSSLLAYVKRNLANSGYFEKEFQKIPYGMKYPATVGVNPYNRKKNKYKDMQAYDHTRVMLKTLPKEQGSDYINANFIKGHAKGKAYIAAQGPTETTIGDFWRMIWEKNVYTIAMVTNLVEEKKTKCLQYWPTVESSTRYGDFTVRTESEAIFAEFTIRNLKVDFEEGKPSRTITQFHFTAWPDHGVPRSTSSLLQFWRKVRNNDANKAHTWLVHCSAGVGRTGTFIATDILYDQGKEKGSVDVYKCVRNLRDQRVNMVQTKDQYLFLHGLMIEALILPSEPVPLEHFHQVLNDLKDVDNAARKTKLLLQYETLKEDMTYRFTKDDTEEKYSAAMLEENRNKNRNNSILPSNEFRPFLATAIAGCTNYINAVYIPSYCDIHGYIITQNPLENTAIDCCRLVYEQEAKVIVTFPSKVKEKDGTYLPEDGTVNLGPFTVTKMSEEDKHFYKKKTFVMAYNSEERELTQLMFNYWPVNCIIPSDPLKMLNFMQEVEFHRRIADNKPVLVQCRDGSEKSGLFVVLMNILERARLDNEVSIPQVIRQLRIRRQQIIPNFEQFKFCHDVLLCHVDSNAVYANM